MASLFISAAHKSSGKTTVSIGLCAALSKRGLDLDGSNSNAALTKSLQSPVILVIDARGTMRGIAPLLIGYQVFDPEVNIAGVIVNMTGGSRHESKLRAAVEHYTDIPFLGALGKDSSISLDEQHIGLIPGYEDPESGSKVSIIAAAVNNHIDLDRLVEIAGTAPGITTMTSKAENIHIFHGITIWYCTGPGFWILLPG